MTSPELLRLPYTKTSTHDPRGVATFRVTGGLAESAVPSMPCREAVVDVEASALAVRRDSMLPICALRSSMIFLPSGVLPEGRPSQSPNCRLQRSSLFRRSTDPPPRVVSGLAPKEVLDDMGKMEVTTEFLWARYGGKGDTTNVSPLVTAAMKFLQSSPKNPATPPKPTRARSNPAVLGSGLALRADLVPARSCCAPCPNKRGYVTVNCGNLTEDRQMARVQR